MTRGVTSGRRRFLKAAGAGATGLGLAGCLGGSDSGTADKIVFYNAGSLEYDPGTAENIERFEEETGITVEVNEVPWNNLKTSLTTIWRGENDKVDAFNGPTWWLADFVGSEWLEPLGLGDDHMNKFPDRLVDLVSFDGEVYMAPEFGKWGSYLYDEEALADAGVSEPPNDWDEVISKGKTLAENGSGFGFTWSDKDVFTFKQFLYQAGGKLFDDGDEPAFVDAGLEVMDFFTTLREEEILMDGFGSMGEGGVGDSFIAGEFATVESWTPLGSRALDADDWGESRLGSAKPPEGPGGSRATFQDTNGISVSAFSERKDAAKQFAEFMTTTESSKTNMLVEGNPAVVPDVYDDSEVRDQYPEWLLEDMRFNLEQAQSETYVAQPQVDDYLSEQLTPTVLGEKDAEGALNAAEENIRSLYEDIGIL